MLSLNSNFELFLVVEVLVHTLSEQSFECFGDIRCCVGTCFEMLVAALLAPGHDISRVDFAARSIRFVAADDDFDSRHVYAISLHLFFPVDQ